jgi:hypothetical protein
MQKQRVLLLNAANMESFPVYPYAFIQVPAVARRAKIDVICRDLLGIPVAAWSHTLQDLLQRHDPAMFLITLRNTDSMSFADYHPNGPGKDLNKAYFPIERTKLLIKTIRELSDKPVAVGGIGFSILAEELMPILRPDFGVFGAADAFFSYFQDIIRGEYHRVANLLYFQGDKIVTNRRVYFPPSREIEYSPQAIQEMMAFYEQFPEPGFMGASLEIIRGCSHACVFCCEPHVAGREVRYRDLAAILGEIKLLVDNGITEMYLISSELNPEENGFILQVADSIRRFNEQQSAASKISWFGANYLLKFDRTDYQRLAASGFTGGWFDITGLDDRNAQAMRTPYRNKTLLSHLKDYIDYQRKGIDHSAADVSGTDQVGELRNAGSQEDHEIRWTMFLGNPATTMETIRETIAQANHEGLSALFDCCHIVRPIRVFDYEQPSIETLEVTFSINNELERVAYRQTMPSFAYPPLLLKHFGSEEAIETMFAHIAETYLSTAYMETRDWQDFIFRQTLDRVRGRFGELPERPSVEHLEKRIESFLHEFLQTFSKELLALGLPTSLAELKRMTPYLLALSLYDSWSSDREVVATICEQAHIGLNDEKYQWVELFIKTVLYRFNVKLLPAYRPLFFEGPT